MVSRILHLSVIVLALLFGMGTEVSAQMRILPREKVDSLAAAQQRPRDWSTDDLAFDSLTVHIPRVREDAAPVSAAFRFRNVGEKTMILDRVESSCTCVKAMLGKKMLAPGEWTMVSVIYEQKGHPGRHDRSIYLYGKPSSKESDELLAVMVLSTDVVMSEDRAGDYPVPFGFFRLKTRRVSFACGRKAVERIGMVNVSDQPRKVTFMKGLLPPGVSVTADKENLAPGEETDIVISYDGGQGVHPSARPVPLKLESAGLPSIQNEIYLIFN